MYTNDFNFSFNVNFEFPEKIRFFPFITAEYTPTNKFNPKILGQITTKN